MRRFGAAAIGVAAGGVAMVLAAAYFVAGHVRDAAEAPVPRVVVEEHQPDRRPRISRDMTETMQNLQRLTDQATPPKLVGHLPPVVSMPAPIESAAPGALATPRPVRPPRALPSPDPVSAPPQGQGAGPASVAPGDRRMPVSLVPYGRKTDGRTVDARDTAAFDALVGRPVVSPGSSSSQPIAAAPDALTQVAQPPDPLQRPELSPEDLSNLTADQLNEREHQRHRNAAGSAQPILPLQ